MQFAVNFLLAIRSGLNHGCVLKMFHGIFDTFRSSFQNFNLLEIFSNTVVTLAKCCELVICNFTDPSEVVNATLL